VVALALSSDLSFADRVQQLLDVIDCRVVQSDDEKDEIYRLRYRAYLQTGAITPNESERLVDKYDGAENLQLFGLYIDGKLASSIRMHVANEQCPTIPAMGVFSDVLSKELEAGKVILDPTRFVTDPAQSKQYPALPYVTLRLCWMAADYFDADHFLATVRTEHQAFYRRVFRHHTVVAARDYPMLTKPICLMSVYYRDVADQVLRRYPFFHSSFFERRMLFEPAELGVAAQGRAGAQLRLVASREENRAPSP